jgi:hypothetical protein
MMNTSEIISLSVSFLLLLRACEAFSDVVEKGISDAQKVRSYLYGLRHYNTAVTLIVIGFGLMVGWTLYRRIAQPFWRVVSLFFYAAVWLYWLVYWINDTLYVHKWYRQSCRETQKE